MAANEQRLAALRLAAHQAEEALMAPGLQAGGAMGSCERAASAADLLRLASSNVARRGVARAVVMGSGGAAGGNSSSGSGVTAAVAGGSSGSGSSSSSGAGSIASGGSLAEVPFEMLVLEVLLDVTAGETAWLYGPVCLPACLPAISACLSVRCCSM